MFDQLSERFSHWLPDGATDEDKNDYLLYILKVYVKEDDRNEDLLEAFVEDVESFTLDDLKKAATVPRRNLRKLLYERGVFVERGAEVSIAAALYKTLTEQPPRPEEDGNRPRSRGNDRSVEDDRGYEQATQGEFGNCHDYSSKTGAVSSIFTNKAGFISNLFKAYTSDSDRYSGTTTDNFERKFMLLLDRCDQAGIKDEDRLTAFSIMLIGAAHTFYYDVLRPQNLKLTELSDHVRNRFQTPERTRALLREWGSLILTTVIANNV